MRTVVKKDGELAVKPGPAASEASDAFRSAALPQATVPTELASDAHPLLHFSKPVLDGNEIDPEDLAQVTPFIDRALSRDVSNGAELLDWVTKFRSPIESVIDDRSTQFAALARIGKADKSISERGTAFERDVHREILRSRNALDGRYLALVATLAETVPPYLTAYTRIIQERADLFCSENVPLEIQQKALTRAALGLKVGTVTFDGQEYSQSGMAAFLESQDRNLRERSWWASREALRPLLTERVRIFEELADLWGTMAKNASSDLELNPSPDRVPNYLFKRSRRNAYSPADANCMCLAVEEHIVPLLQRMLDKRLQRLREMGQIPSGELLGPWDIRVDLSSEAALKHFEDADGVFKVGAKLFEGVDPELVQLLSHIRELRGYDIKISPGREPGFFLADFQWRREPFIFGQIAGIHRDLPAIVHEVGHAFAQWLSRHHEILEYRQLGPPEMEDVASFGLEALSYDCLPEICSPAQVAMAKRQSLERVLEALSLSVRCYLHELRLYRNEKPNWVEQESRWTGGMVDFGKGAEEHIGLDWIKHGRVISDPLGMFGYGPGSLASLEILRRSRVDRAKTIADFKSALALGQSISMPEFFERAIGEWPLDPSRVDAFVERCASFLRTELESLGSI